MRTKREMFWEEMDEMTDLVYRASHQDDFGNCIEDIEVDPQDVNQTTLILNEDPFHRSERHNSWDELDSIESIQETPVAGIVPIPSRTSSFPETGSHTIFDQSSTIQDFTIDASEMKNVVSMTKPKGRPKPVVVSIPNPKGRKKISEKPPLLPPLKRRLSDHTEISRPKRQKPSPDGSDASAIEDFSLLSTPGPSSNLSRATVKQLPKSSVRSRPLAASSNIGSTSGQAQSSKGKMEVPPLDPKRFVPSILRLPGGRSITEEILHPHQQQSAKEGSDKLSKRDKKTGRPLSITPSEYINLLNEGVYELPKKGNRTNNMSGMTIFIVYDSSPSEEMTNHDFSAINLMTRHGANVVPTFDAAIVTHIVCFGNSKTKAIVQIGVENLKDIPSHIPTLKLEWVRQAATENYQAHQRYWPKFAVFGSRANVGQLPPEEREARRQLVKERVRRQFGNPTVPKEPLPTTHSEFDDSADEEEAAKAGSSLSQMKPTPKPTSPGAGNTKKDPLAPFYTMARSAVENAIGRHGETGEDEFDSGEEDVNIQPEPKKPVKKASGWTCDRKPQDTPECPNQDIIDKLDVLRGLHEAKPGEEDRWKAFAYSKAIRALRTYPSRIKSVKEAEGIKGIGSKTALKIMEIAQTGELKRIEYETTEDVLVTRVFAGIYGVGTKTAYQWYMHGHRTLDDLRNNAKKIGLSTAQIIGLDNYDDINSRMPREEASELFSVIKPIALGIDPKLEIQIMGSYRRGKATCGDIDIMITRNPTDGKTHEGVLQHLLKALRNKGIITDDLACPDDPNDEECIYRGLCRLPIEGAQKRRIDFLAIPWKNRGAALIYYTGDDIFNRAMRYKANRMGYSLNQRGLFAGVVRDPRDRFKKLNTGNIIASSTEEEIFRILEVPWQEPHERVRNLS